MINEFKGIENKVQTKVGDLILLKSNILNVCGFVINFTPKKIEISKEDPVSRNYGHQAWEHKYRKNYLLGNKIYNLKKFGDYEILKEAGKAGN